MTTLIHDAVLFDLDGVLTSTAALHAQCWKLTFDPVLSHHGQAPACANSSRRAASTWRRSPYA
jgi:beta-phosphoglucomutase-like phosphatase (HAD superfamily)